MTQLEQDIEKKRAELIKMENRLIMEQFKENAKNTTAIHLEVTTSKQMYSISIEEHNFGEVIAIISKQGNL